MNLSGSTIAIVIAAINAGSASLGADISAASPWPDIFHAGGRWEQLDEGTRSCEGPQWTVADGKPLLTYSAPNDRLVYHWCRQSGLTTWRDDAPEVTASRPDGHGGFYVIEQLNRRVARWDYTGKEEKILADRFEGHRLNRPNDLVVKSDGSLWFTDPGDFVDQRRDERKELDGQFVFRLDPKTHELRAVARELKFPNGIAFSPDEKYLFLTDSGADAILRAEVLPDGNLGPREVFARISVQGLDGLAFDHEGRLWCAAMDGVYVFDITSRTELGKLSLRARPTAIAFAPGLVCVTTQRGAFVLTFKP